MVKLEFPRDGSTIDTHTPLQNEFISRIQENGTEAALEWLLPRKCEKEFSLPAHVRFAWTDDGSDSYYLEIAEDSDFLSAFSVVTPNNCYVYRNLKIGQKYYWRVNGSQPFSFDTADNKYRFIEIDGLLNVRDVGGINIKQGMIYRGAELNKEYLITDAGKATVKHLGIKTEVNLRKDSDYAGTSSAAGDDVRYKLLPYRPYREVFEEEHRKGIVDIMEFLADEQNYPIYFHCLGGADRTGMIALYLRALLGECDEDILIDYELTSLSTYSLGLSEGVSSLGFRSRNAEYFAEFLNMFNTYAGETLAEKTVQFLLECNVKQETLAKIRGILAK